MINENWNCIDPTQERQDEKRAVHQAKLQGVVARLARDPDGQYFLRWLVHGSGLFEAGYPADHAKAAYQEGQRLVGVAIFQLCAAVGAGAILVNFKEVNNG